MELTTDNIRIKFSEIFRKYNYPDDFIDALDSLDKLLNLLCKNRDYYLDCINFNVIKLIDYNSHKNLCEKDTEEIEDIKAESKSCYKNILYLNSLMSRLAAEFEKKFKFRHRFSRLVNYDTPKLYEILVEGKENDEKDTEKLIRETIRRWGKNRSVRSNS